jgi:hypothetical protein
MYGVQKLSFVVYFNRGLFGTLDKPITSRSVWIGVKMS